jgi:hypothetical protein
MNTADWTYFYKLGEAGNPCWPQQTYEPLISPDRKTFCMNYDPANYYQHNLTKSDRSQYKKEIVEWFFENEITFLEYLADKPYMPRDCDISFKDRKIFFSWNDICCNHFTNRTQNWPREQWLESIKNIILDQIHSGVYKLSMYPHCHFIDKDGSMKAFDYYSSVFTEEPMIPKTYVDAILSDTSTYRLKDKGVVCNEWINVEEMFKNALLYHVKWGSENLDFIYRNIEWPK